MISVLNHFAICASEAAMNDISSLTEIYKSQYDYILDMIYGLQYN